jgi:hypothetical protein
MQDRLDIQRRSQESLCSAYTSTSM